MKKKTKTIILTSLMLFVMFVQIVYAMPTELPTVEPNISDATVAERVNAILGAVQYISYAVAVGMIMYIGIRYMMKPANERAEFKNGSIRFVVGAILIAGAGVIFQIISSVVINSTTAQN